MASSPAGSVLCAVGRTVSNVSSSNLLDLLNVTNRETNASICVGNASTENVYRTLDTSRCGLTGMCIFFLARCLFVFGVIANLVVIWRTAVDRRLRTPTFVAIACLALSDAVFLTANVYVSANSAYEILTCAKPVPLHKKKTQMALLGLFWFSANAHVSIIAVVRYILLLHPFKTSMLTTRRVLITSAVAWFISICLWMALYVLDVKGTITPSVEMNLLVWGSNYISPLLITSALHVTKCVRVRRPSIADTSLNLGRIQRTTERMPNTILLIIICALVLPLPKFVFENVERVEGHSFRMSTTALWIRGTVLVLFLFNNCVNPLVYAFQSKAFRRSIKRGLSACCKSAESKNGRLNSSTSLSYFGHSGSLRSTNTTDNTSAVIQQLECAKQGKH